MPSVINGREWRDDDQARSQAVEAEPRELKRTEPMTRNQLRELCVTLCDRFPFVSDNRWLGPSIGKPCGPSSPVLKIAFGCDPCRQTEDTVAPRLQALDTISEVACPSPRPPRPRLRKSAKTTSARRPHSYETCPPPASSSHQPNRSYRPLAKVKGIGSGHQMLGSIPAKSGSAAPNKTPNLCPSLHTLRQE